jgi:hypothetical protein
MESAPTKTILKKIEPMSPKLKNEKIKTLKIWRKNEKLI